MKKNILLLASVVVVMLIPSSLYAEVILDLKNRTVKGAKTDKTIERLNPGTYKFTLKIVGKKKAKVKFVINQKNAVVGIKKLHKSKYGRGTHQGTFVVQARRLQSASGSAAGEYRNDPTTGTQGASASGAFEADMANVDATRKITFKVSNPVGKKKIKYSLKIIRQ